MDNINTLIIQVFSALSTGGAVVVSQYLGRQDTDNAKAASKQLLYAMCALSLLLMGAALVLRQHILALIFGRVEADVMENALVYFLLTATAYPFMGIYNAGAALFRAMGNSKVSMFCSLVVNVINITVNAVLIFGFGMGAAGAGIGFLVAMVLFSGVRRKVEEAVTPKCFEGLPITLVSAAVTSLSFMGFGGIIESIFHV